MNIQQLIFRFFNAVAFYTRIPCPNWVEYHEQHLNRASAFFPLMGYLVAGFSVLIFWLCQMLFSVEISVLMSLGASILFTGAFHEDGFADLCDGFGGGLTQGDILKIMKDSRLGTYGVIGLIVLLAVKWQVLIDLASLDISYLFIALVVSHSLSRAFSISLIMVLPYVQAEALSKAQPIANDWHPGDMAFAWLTALLPLLLLPLEVTIWLIAIGLINFYWIYKWFQQRLLGYTGDALGACQQIQEVGCYLVLLTML